MRHQLPPRKSACKPAQKLERGFKLYLERKQFCPDPLNDHVEDSSHGPSQVFRLLGCRSCEFGYCGGKTPFKVRVSECFCLTVETLQNASSLRKPTDFPSRAPRPSEGNDSNRRDPSVTHPHWLWMQA